MKNILLAITLIMTPLSFAQSKIIEIEDGSSFIGTYYFDQDRSMTNCHPKDAYDNKIQIMSLPLYRGLKIVAAIGILGKEI